MHPDQHESRYMVGLDVGSTTVKAVVVERESDKIIWSDYQRHETKQPEKVNRELKAVLPREMWEHWNALMVMFGRKVCLPTYPRCPKCFLNDVCPKIGVDKVSSR